MARLFYALWPDEDTRAALAEAATYLDIRDGRAVRPENLHLTLHFLGEIDGGLADELGTTASVFDIAPFAIDIGDAGWWRGAQVAWLAPLTTPPELEELYLRLRTRLNAFEVATDDRAFRPHLTVARKVRRAPRVSGTIAVRWRVEDFALVASRSEPAGARYEVLNRWRLSA